MLNFSRYLVLAPAIVLLGGTFALFSVATSAQGAVKVDSKHYKVEFENDKVRVLRIHYGPHEKGVMHSHPESVVIYLNDVAGKFTLPDGKTVDAAANAGTVMWSDAVTHQPENTGDKSFDIIQVEFKHIPNPQK